MVTTIQLVTQLSPISNEEVPVEHNVCLSGLIIYTQQPIMTDDSSCLIEGLTHSILETVCSATAFTECHYIPLRLIPLFYSHLYCCYQHLIWYICLETTDEQKTRAIPGLKQDYYIFSSCSVQWRMVVTFNGILTPFSKQNVTVSVLLYLKTVKVLEAPSNCE